MTDDDKFVGVFLTIILFIVALGGYIYQLSKIKENSTPEEKSVVGRWKKTCIVVGALMVFVYGLILINVMSSPSIDPTFTPTQLIVAIVFGVILIVVPFALPSIMKKQV